MKFLIISPLSLCRVGGDNGAHTRAKGSMCMHMSTAVPCHLLHRQPPDATWEQNPSGPVMHRSSVSLKVSASYVCDIYSWISRECWQPWEVMLAVWTGTCFQCRKKTIGVLRKTTKKSSHSLSYWPTTSAENDNTEGKEKIRKPRVPFSSPSLLISQPKVETAHRMHAYWEVE